MSTDIYEMLREQLDQYSVGFPATASGVEIKILKRLFTKDEAGMYLDMTMMLETPEQISTRIKRDIQWVGTMLETMAQKGVLFRLRKKNTVKYAAVPFVIGAYEFQLKNIDRQFSEMMEKYFDEGFLDLSPHKNILPLRTVPVNQSIDINHPVASYAQARDIIKAKKKIAVADCICRVQQDLIDKGCGKPKEVCLMFGSHADFYVENKLGRYISTKEALSILDACEKAGLVNQPANMVNPGGMCNCCGDCCGVLRSLKKLPRPADSVYNDYYAVVDTRLCTACSICLDRCQMDAIEMNDEPVVYINTDRCIGCGLCVTTCAPEALSLELKPEDERFKPPPNGRKLMTRTAKLRGKSLIPISMSEK